MEGVGLSVPMGGSKGMVDVVEEVEEVGRTGGKYWIDELLTILVDVEEVGRIGAEYCIDELPSLLAATHCPVLKQYWPDVQQIGPHGDSPVM
jgi:hypothetical protein